MDVAELRRLISYNPETGEFTRLNSVGRWKAGPMILTPDGEVGRVRICIGGKPVQAAQVAWALMNGEWPSQGVICANGNRSDLRWENLKPCILSMKDLVPKGQELTQEILRSVLDYDQETGAFTWRIAVVQHKAGEQAGFATANGYLKIGIAGREVFAHRLAWLWMTGAWPENDVDHIDGDRTNNRWTNLRAATRGENLQNQRVARSNNQHSKLLGASLHKQTGKWLAQIKYQGKHEYIGLFDTVEEAHEAYVARKRQVHTHGVL